MQLTALLTQLSSSQPMFKTSEHTSLRHTITVAYLGGGHGAMPPWLDHENFLQATLYEKVRFLPFSARIAKFNNV